MGRTVEEPIQKGKLRRGGRDGGYYFARDVDIISPEMAASGRGNRAADAGGIGLGGAGPPIS